MKRVLFSIIAFTFLGLTASVAQAVTGTATEVVQAQDEKVKIKSEELPEAVKTTLASEDYKGWEVSAAYHIKSKDEFEVELKNGEEVKTVKFDKDGKEVK